jgi:hypothetical protein
MYRKKKNFTKKLMVMRAYSIKEDKIVKLTENICNNNIHLFLQGYPRIQKDIFNITI